MCLHERRKPCVKGFIGSLHKPGNISLFLSFTPLVHPLHTGYFITLGLKGERMFLGREDPLEKG